MTAALAALALLTLQVQGDPVRERRIDGMGEAVSAAYRRFQAAHDDIRAAVVRDITVRIEESQDEAVREVLSLRDRAVDRLEIRPAREPAFHDPDLYTPGQWSRKWADAAAPRSLKIAERFGPWDWDRPLAGGTASGNGCGIRYDFAANVGRLGAGDPTPDAALLDLVYGYAPGSDALIAWLMGHWDHRGDLDPVAEHFSFNYCDRDGTCYPGVDLWDALGSGFEVEMPDVDVVAYFTKVVGKNIPRSPIPSFAHGRLYDEISKGFTPYWQHRTLLEAAALLYVNPAGPLRPQHEEMRERLLYLFFEEQGDIGRIGRRIKKAGGRDELMEALDANAKSDPGYIRKWREFAGRRNEARVWVSAMARRVLDEYGFFDAPVED